MDNVIVISVLILGGIAILAAIILYVIAKKFKVEEDPRIDLVAECLPGANCGGCGFAGCRNFAEACVFKPRLPILKSPSSDVRAARNAVPKPTLTKAQKHALSSLLLTAAKQAALSAVSVSATAKASVSSAQSKSTEKQDSRWSTKKNVPAAEHA